MYKRLQVYKALTTCFMQAAFTVVLQSWYLKFEGTVFIVTGQDILHFMLMLHFVSMCLQCSSSFFFHFYTVLVQYTYIYTSEVLLFKRKAW